LRSPAQGEGGATKEGKAFLPRRGGGEGEGACANQRGRSTGSRRGEGRPRECQHGKRHPSFTQVPKGKKGESFLYRRHCRQPGKGKRENFFLKGEQALPIPTRKRGRSLFPLDKKKKAPWRCRRKKGEEKERPELDLTSGDRKRRKKGRDGTVFLFNEAKKREGGGCFLQKKGGKGPLLSVSRHSEARRWHSAAFPRASIIKKKRRGERRFSLFSWSDRKGGGGEETESSISS